MVRETPQDRRPDWPVEGRRGRYNPRLDELRSEAGRLGITTGRDAIIFTVPFGKAFHIRGLQMALSGTPAQFIRLYASTAGGMRRTLLNNAMAPGATRALSDIVGWVVVASASRRSHIIASTGPGGVGDITAVVRVAGVLRNRLAGETTSGSVPLTVGGYRRPVAVGRVW